MSERRPTPPAQPVPDVDALVHALDVHQAELEVQNQELIAANEELRRANAELAFARDRYRVLHELAPAALVTIGPGGVILDVNLAAEKLFGTPRRQLIDRRLAQFIAEASRPVVAPKIAALFAMGFVRGVELTLDGAPPIEVILDGAVLPDGARACALLGFVDCGQRAIIVGPAAAVVGSVKKNVDPTSS